MVDEVINQRIICEGGLNTNESDLILSEILPGSASRLVNFEVSPSGGYRRINGYAPFSPDAPTVSPVDSEGAVLGVVGFYNTTKKLFEVFAARKDKGSQTYSIYKFDGSSSSWEKETLPSARNMVGIDESVIRLRFEQLNYGGGNHLLAVDGVNKILWYDGSTWKQIVQQNTQPAPPEGEDLPDLPEPGGDQAIESPSVICVFKNHVFVASDDGNRSIIAHSAPLQVDEWRVAQGAGQLFPGFDVVQIKTFRDELYVFGETQIKKIVVDGLNFVMKDVAHQIGCVARDSVLEVGGSLIFLSQDGIRPIAGTERINDVEMNLISRGVQKELEDLILYGDLRSLVGIPFRTKTQFRYFFSSGLIPKEEAKGFIGAIRSNSRIEKQWEFGELLGIRVSSGWSGHRNGREIVIFGDYNGKVYQMDVGNTFDGNNIFSIYRTPYLDFGDTKIRKLFRTLTTWIRAEGNVSMAIGVEADWGNGRLVLPSNYTISADGGNSLYDNLKSVYNSVSTVYGGVDSWNQEINIQGSYFSIRFSFVTYGAYAPFIIQGLVTELTSKGRQ